MLRTLTSFEMNKNTSRELNVLVLNEGKCAS